MIPLHEPKKSSTAITKCGEAHLRQEEDEQADGVEPGADLINQFRAQLTIYKLHLMVKYTLVQKCVFWGLLHLRILPAIIK
jgi:hypothetical protein